MTRRNARLRREAGMTLIELLLAVTLFAAISGSIGVVLRVAFTTMNKIDAKVDFNRRVIASQRALDQILNGLIPVITPCAGQPVGFSGNPNVMRFVSSFSLTEGSRGRPQVVELFVDRNPKGGLRLLLNERPYFGKRSLTAVCGGPAVVAPNSFVLADRLALCQFAYRRLDKESKIETWSRGWIFPEWPTAIRLEMSPLEFIPNQIQPATVIAPIFVFNGNTDNALL